MAQQQQQQQIDHVTNTSSQQQQRAKEIDLIHNLIGLFQGAKQELNNDLTKLAYKDLPLMSWSEQQQQQEQQQLQQHEQDNRESLSQGNSKEETGRLDGQVIEELEPLDLDV